MRKWCWDLITGYRFEEYPVNYLNEFEIYYSYWVLGKSITFRPGMTTIRTGADEVEGIALHEISSTSLCPKF